MRLTADQRDMLERAEAMGDLFVSGPNEARNANRLVSRGLLEHVRETRQYRIVRITDDGREMIDAERSCA